METEKDIQATPAKELPACPVEMTLMLISDKWKVLTAQLRQMEESGLVTRTVFPEVPPHVEYTLTDLGYSLKPVLDAMWDWGENYKAQNGK
ncbi:MAG: helix-turn-helix transcriptional regulator [Lachnospiraceae bacterium]|nr:helix-turn-helix transcriptional regulator [Lachnospiraceae bacterium]